jgi:hypothetical protein
VVSLNDHDTDPRIGKTRSAIFGSNLITFDGEELTQFIEAPDDVTPDRLTLEENLWWSPMPPDKWDKLGDLGRFSQWPQVTSVNPNLNTDYEPRAQAAKSFGAHAP